MNQFERFHFTIIDSTQEYLKRNIDLLKKHKQVLVTAKQQTNGRGSTADRKWLSPPGNLLVTFGFSLDLDLKEIAKLILYPMIEQVMSLAVAETLDIYNLKTEIKWENDLIVNFKKICGILCEVIDEKGTVVSKTSILPEQCNILIGIGLNINMDKEHNNLVDQPITSMLQETKKEHDIEKILELLAEKVFDYFSIYIKQGFEYFRKKIFHRMCFVEHFIKIRDMDNQSIYEGWFESIDCLGQLILRLPNGEKISLRSGSIVTRSFWEKQILSIISNGMLSRIEYCSNKKNDQKEFLHFRDKMPYWLAIRQILINYINILNSSKLSQDQDKLINPIVEFRRSDTDNRFRFFGKISASLKYSEFAIFSCYLRR